MLLVFQESTKESFNLHSADLSSFFAGPPPIFPSTASSNSKPRVRCEPQEKPVQVNGSLNSSAVIDLTEDEDLLHRQAMHPAKTKKSGEKVKQVNKEAKAVSSLNAGECNRMAYVNAVMQMHLPVIFFCISTCVLMRLDALLPYVLLTYIWPNGPIHAFGQRPQPNQYPKS